MPRRNKTRRLWIKIKYSVPDASKETILRTLIKSIERGHYQYPRNWRIALGWSNKEDGVLKWGEFTREMSKSAESSEGFDYAVESYLENQLNEIS